MQSTLLSLDNCILLDPICNNYNNKIIKCILNFNLYQLIDILVTTVYNNIIVECIFITKDYSIITFKQDNLIILTLYLFICTNYYYLSMSCVHIFVCHLIIIL